MTHEEIERAIEELRELGGDGCITNADIIDAVFSGNNFKVRDALIALLQQADPYSHVELPLDADGVPIRVGDELCGYGRPDGGVYCKATNGYMVFVGEDGERESKQWMVWDPDNCRHYHKPTIEDVLVDYYKECRLHASELGFVTDEGKEKAWRDIAATFADKLREAMVDDDAR